MNPALVSRLIDARSGVAGADRALDRHLQAHPEDSTLARQLGQLWDDIGRVPAPPLRLTIAESASPVPTSRFGRIYWTLNVAIAASVAAAALLLPWPSLPTQRSPEVAVERIVAGSSTREIKLSDGSTVTMAPRSALQVRMANDRRGMRLEAGEAYFKVAHDKARPFVVATRDGETIAVGTAFDVRLRKSETVVTVTEGKIKVTAVKAGAPRFATIGERVRYRAVPAAGEAAIDITDRADVRDTVDWTTGMLRFEGAPLAEVIERVNQHSADSLVLHDRSLAGMPIFATLKTGEVEGLLAIVAAQASLDPAGLQRALRHEKIG